MEQIFYTPKEVAKLLGGYHRSTIYRMIQSGELPAKKVRGRIGGRYSCDGIPRRRFYTYAEALDYLGTLPLPNEDR